MRSDFETVAFALDEFDCSRIINNPQLASTICSISLFGTGGDGTTPNPIVILGDQDRQNWNILQSSGNYVVIDDTEKTARTAIGPDSNAMILPHGTSLERVVRLVGNAVAGLATIHHHATQLLDVALKGGSLDGIMDLAAGMLGNPTCLLVMDGSAIAASQQVETNDELWDRLVYQRVRTTEDADLSNILEYAQSQFYGNITRPVFFDAKPWKRRLMAGVWIGGSCKHLFVVLENNRRILPEDYVVTDCICELLANALKKEAPRSESPTALFEELLRGERVDVNRALKIVRSAGLDTHTPARLAILYEEDQPPSYLRAMQLLDKARQALPRANALVHENRVVLTLPYEDAETYDLLSRLPTSAEAPRLIMGVSHPIASFEEVKRAYRQCEAALELGSTMPVRRYEDVMSIDLIRQLPATHAPEEYCPKISYDVVAYDRANGTEYAWTILRWLRHFKNYRKVAEELHIHANTVRYRLERASELFDIDMNDDALVDCLRTSFEIMMAAGVRLPRI